MGDFLLIFILLTIIGMVYIKNKEIEEKREDAGNAPFPPEWEEILARNVAIYSLMPEEIRKRYKKHIKIFINEKYFEGCGGLIITDEIKVTVAAQACLLLLNSEKPKYYRGLISILVYPDAYIVKNQRHWDGTVKNEVRLGESWTNGMVVLSWKNLVKSSQEIGNGGNVGIHEFAHQADAENGRVDGMPGIYEKNIYNRWIKIFAKEFNRIKKADRTGYDGVMDTYGVKNPAEFFAVATETFFLDPAGLKNEMPELYEMLMNYYKVDTAKWYGK